MELSDTAQWLQLVGRVLFVFVFLPSAFGHLTQSKAMAGFAASKGLPAARLMVIVTGLMLLAGSIGVVLGIWIDIAALLLVAFLVPTALVMHSFWTLSDPQERMQDQIQFNKDVSLAGGALLLFVLAAVVGPELGFTITDPVIDLLK
jgi:uncharacterized membrane protein YphA (DoxX/SURF4 family)